MEEEKMTKKKIDEKEFKQVTGGRADGEEMLKACKAMIGNMEENGNEGWEPWKPGKCTEHCGFQSPKNDQAVAVAEKKCKNGVF